MFKLNFTHALYAFAAATSKLLPKELIPKTRPPLVTKFPLDPGAGMENKGVRILISPDLDRKSILILAGIPPEAITTHTQYFTPSDLTSSSLPSQAAKNRSTMSLCSLGKMLWFQGLQSDIKFKALGPSAVNIRPAKRMPLKGFPSWYMPRWLVQYPGNDCIQDIDGTKGWVKTSPSTVLALRHHQKIRLWSWPGSTKKCSRHRWPGPKPRPCRHSSTTICRRGAKYFLTMISSTAYFAGHVIANINTFASGDPVAFTTRGTGHLQKFLALAASSRFYNRRRDIAAMHEFFWQKPCCLQVRPPLWKARKSLTPWKQRHLDTGNQGGLGADNGQVNFFLQGKLHKQIHVIDGYVYTFGNLRIPPLPGAHKAARP